MFLCDNCWRFIPYLKYWITVLCSWEYYGCMTVCFYHVIYVLEVNPHSVIALISMSLTRNRNAIWNLSDSNGMRTQNHLARKQTLNVFVYELSGCGLESRCSYLKFSYLNMEELWTGITFKKFPCYMHACSWRIGKNTRTFLTYVKRFWVIPCMKNCRNLIALCKKVFRNSPIIFLQQENKAKLVQIL